MGGPIFQRGKCIPLSILLLLSFVFAGCGTASDGGTGNFVFTGNNQNNNATPDPGVMTFNFVKAQSPLTVPNSTTRIRFRFYSDADGKGTLLQQEFRDFAASITIDPVDGRTRSVVVTALDGNGYPVLQSTLNTPVVSGQEITPDFGSATTVNVTADALIVTPTNNTVIPVGGTQQFTASLVFSNGEELSATDVVWTANGQVSVNATGLATGTTDGIGSVTATRDTLATTVNIVVGTGPILTTLTVAPDGLTVGTGSSLDFTVTGVDQNGDPFPLTGVVWSIEAGTASINPNTGRADFPTENVVTVRATVGTVFDDATITVLQSVPTVTFSGSTTGLLTFLSTETPNIVDAMGEVMVTDNQPALDGGILRFRLGTPGSVFNARFTVPATTIGTVSSNNGPNVQVLLNDTATPDAIETLIEGVTISFGGTSGNGTIVVELSDGNGNNAVPATRAFTIPNPVPQVTLDAATLTFDVNDEVAISAGATVTDDVDPVTTGTLNFSLTGTVNDALFIVPDLGIGTVNNNGSTASIDLTNATLAQIQNAINGTTLRYGGTKGSGTINVTLTDADGNTSPAGTRAFVITPLSLTVADSMADETTIAAAINTVMTTPGADGSTITVLSGYTGTMETLTISGGGNLNGLMLIGNASGQSAGVVPSITPRMATVVNSIAVNGTNAVTIDGFDPADTVGVSIINCNSAIVRNCLFDSNATGLVANDSPSVSVQNCGFQNGAIGASIGGSSTATLTGNAFVSNSLSGLDVLATATATVTGNGFLTNTVNHLYSESTGLVTARNNDFGNNGGTVETGGTSSIDARENWWGQNTGPLGGQVVEGTGSIDTTLELVNDPFPGFGT